MFRGFSPERKADFFNGHKDLLMVRFLVENTKKTACFTWCERLYAKYHAPVSPRIMNSPLTSSVLKGISFLASSQGL